MGQALGMSEPGSVWPPYVTREMSATEAIEFALSWLDTSPDEEMLGRSALTQMEPLVDWHWRELEDYLLLLQVSNRR